ncbi:MAG: right-handed parallel beta-helix repeat-containing protein [Phycisphaerales bacterium]
MLWFTPVAAVVASVTLTDVKVDSIAALRDAARTAKPGDRLLLAPGTYSGTLMLDGLKGEKGRPIVIGAVDPKNPPVIRGGSEGLHLSKPAYVTVQDLVVERATGNGINIDDGGDRTALAPGVQLSRLCVRDIGEGASENQAGKGNCDGIKLSGLTGFKVQQCTVERWGTGGSAVDMVGCHDGWIAGCTFRHVDPGDGEQQGASAVQMKGGTRGVTVTSSRFEHAGQRAVNIGGSTGLQFFRPPLSDGDAPRSEASDINVEACTFVGSDAAVAFVGVDGAIVRFNTIYQPRRWALRILQETRSKGFVPCRKGVFENNIVVVGGGVGGRAPSAVNVGDATDAASFTFANNVWFGFGTTPPSLPVKETGGSYGVDPRLRDPAKGDFMPARDGPAKNAGVFAAPKPK